MRACLNQCQNPEGFAPATHGFVCQRCYEGIETALPKVPAMLMHLREIYTMHTRNLDGAQRIKKDPPAPFNLHAWDFAEQLFYALTENTMRSSYTVTEVLEIAQGETNRLLRNLPTIANTRHVQSLLKLPKLTRQIEMTFPMREARRATALPCPQCNKRTIYTPPQHYGDNLEVVCFDCGFRIPPEKIEFYARLAEKETARDK